MWFMTSSRPPNAAAGRPPLFFFNDTATTEIYTLSLHDALPIWNDRSRANLGVDTIDLVQLHCPPTPVYSRDEVYDALDELVELERIKAYGVSVETVDEALTAIARPAIASVQIILNVFRQKPLEQVLSSAADSGVA